MSLHDQARSLLEKGADMRQQIFGTDSEGRPTQIDYDNGAQIVDGYYTLIRSQEQLDNMGCFRQSHDAVVRSSKTQLIDPELNKTIKLTLVGDRALLVRIDEFGNNDLSPEWVLGCKSIF
jgi:hypothetical protein